MKDCHAICSIPLRPWATMTFKTYFELRIAETMRQALFVFAVVIQMVAIANAQMLAEPAVFDKAEALENPTRIAIAKEQALINQIYEPELLLRVEQARSKIIHTNFPIARSAISNPDIVDIQVFDANELEIIGKQVGETTITFWFDIPNQGREVLRYLVQVDDVKQEQRRREARYKALQSRINELFPGSQVFLFPVENKVIVRGQARDAKEADEIIRLLGQRNALNNSAAGQSGYLDLGSGNANGDEPFETDGDIFVNLLTVPGEQQVMLKVRVAELVRNSGRNAGVDFNISDGNFQISSILGGAGNLTAILDDGDVQFFLQAISSHSYGKILAEPTLVTISGQAAQFLSGGEFAVPTAVGVGGVGAATTTFRGFGTQLQFTPTVLDKDLIRLQVSPSFSSLNAAASVDGIPGLSTRSLNTTVDLREGQWLAVAGLIQDESGGAENTGSVPRRLAVYWWPVFNDEYFAFRNGIGGACQSRVDSSSGGRASSVAAAGNGNNGANRRRFLPSKQHRRLSRI